MTQKDNGPGLGRNYGETGVFTFGRKVVFGLKIGFTPKNHPKWHFPPWLFGQRHFFFWTTYSGRGQNMVRGKKWVPFFGSKFWFLAQKSNFCHTTPILVDDPFLALAMTVNFPPWERFFDFPFQSYSCFRKKNLADGSKSLPPSHCGSSVCQ